MGGGVGGGGPERLGGLEFCVDALGGELGPAMLLPTCKGCLGCGVQGSLGG